MALTQQDLINNKVKLNEMRAKINILMKALEIAIKGEIEGITLTTDQKTILKNIYINQKADLATLYGQLI